MKIFNIFNYRITIRKVREKKPHAMDTRAYGRARFARARQVKRDLEAVAGKKETWL